MSGPVETTNSAAQSLSGPGANVAADGGRGDDTLVVDANGYLADCFRLARRIWDDGYRPDFLIALWRGGAPPGIVIHEYFRSQGHDPYHTAIRTRSLESVRGADGFDIKGLEHVIDAVDAEHRLLIVDDLFDTGRTVHEVIDYLDRRARRNMPEIRSAAVYFRPARRSFLVGPHYYLHAVDAKPIFPHRVSEMSQPRLRVADPQLHRIFYGSVTEENR